MASQTLRGKTALITGAGQRLGRAIALALAGEGVNIVVHYHRSAEEAQQLGGQLREMGVQAWELPGDLGQAPEAAALVARALERVGPIDLLVNNASIYPVDTLETMTVESLVTNVEVNAWAPMVLCRAFAQTIGRGTIINLLDARLHSYDWTHVSYLLSKQMLASFTRMAAIAFAPAITVNAVAPGLILPPPGKDRRFLERMNDTVPLKRHGEPEDIAEAVIFLARSTYLTGQILYVDGGRHLVEYAGGPHPGE
jgi:pteridine reductase